MGRRGLRRFRSSERYPGIEFGIAIDGLFQLPLQAVHEVVCRSIEGARNIFSSCQSILIRVHGSKLSRCIMLPSMSRVTTTNCGFITADEHYVWDQQCSRTCLTLAIQRRLLVQWPIGETLQAQSMSLLGRHAFAGRIRMEGQRHLTVRSPITIAHLKALVTE